MSENPYRSTPSSHTPVGVYSQQKPTGLTVIAVICLVIGILGASLSLFAIVMQFFQGAINEFQGAQPSGLSPEYLAEIKKAQESQFLPNLIFGGCNLIVGSLLVTGSIGVLGLKEWGRNLLRNTLLVAILFVVIRGIYGMWIQYHSMSTITNMVPADSEHPGALEMIMQITIIVGLVVSIIWTAGLAFFYVWSRRYLNKPPIRTLFGAPN